MFAICPRFEQKIEVRGDDLWHATLVGRYPFDQIVLATGDLRFCRCTEAFSDEGVHFILTIFLMKKIENLVEWDVRSRSVLQPRLEGGTDLGPVGRIIEFDDVPS